MTPSSTEIWAALSGVRDPELDRPITDLGFVSLVSLRPASGPAVSVRVELRLPTYFCAPNFAWLMVADARDAVTAVSGAGTVTVVLLDHFVADEINAGVAAATAFDSSFAADGLDPGLEELRTTFERKAHLAAQERLARAVAPGLASATEVGELTLADASRLAPEEAAAVSRRRQRLGIISSYAVCDDAGEPVSAAALPGWLRFARTVRVSIDGNAGLCRGLLETRYGLSRAEPA